MIEIPGYIIKKEIGHGGMAKVYLATHEGLQRDVAIKVMFKNLSKDSTYSERFIREARIVAQLSHNNIITVFDVGVHDGNHYIAMEFLPGETLDDKINAGLAPKDSLELLKQISAGLQYAHDKNFIHRDIKPENILFREDDTPVISDFGIARATESDTKMTEEGTVIGTALYMSPEQAQGHKISSCSDLYSLGIVFYEMLTGNVPYNADSSIAIAFKHIKDPIPTLENENKKYQLILNKLLAKSPKDRYQSCKEIISDVEFFIDGNKSSSRATEFMARDRHNTEFINFKIGSSNRWKIITGITSIIVVTGVVAAYSLIYSPQQKQQSQDIITNQQRLEQEQKDLAAAQKKLKDDEQKRQTEAKQRLAEKENNKLAAEQQAKQDKIAADNLAREKLLADKKTKKESQRLKDKKALEAKKAAEKSRIANENKRKQEELLTKAETMLLKTKLNSLLASADRKKLTSQLRDSHKNFKAVLRLDSNNKKAKVGIDQISQQFLDMALREANKKNFNQADNFVKNVINIAPTYTNLISTQQKINTLRNEHKSAKAKVPAAVKTPEKNNRPNFGGF